MSNLINYKGFSIPQPTPANLDRRRRDRHQHGNGLINAVTSAINRALSA